MSKIVWDKTGERLYETGVDHCALYVMGENGTYSAGVAWNGITGITNSPSGAEPSPIYADNIKYLNLMSAEEFGATITAYTYPDEFSVCDGSASPAEGIKIGQQTRKSFGLAYRTLIGNDVEGQDHGYKIHLIYNALAAPSERSYSTVNDSPEAIELSWEVTTTPVEIDGYKPTAHIEIDSTKVEPAKLATLESKLYGTDEAGQPTLPSPAEVIAIFKTA